MTTRQPVTQVATTDISDLLNPAPDHRMDMTGFDEEFVDFPDYIIRITDRIWHERKVELCLRYYAEDSVIHTLAGDITGAKTVEANTHATLAAFPDRTLDGDNVIWSGNPRDGYYSSHLITSRMTNLGDSEFGPATGKRARVRTIADCLCKDNQVVEEWLVRDNGALVTQLGFNLDAIARSQANADRDADKSVLATLAPWREATIAGADRTRPALPKTPEEMPEAFATAVFSTLWTQKDVAILPSIYDFRVGAHLPTQRELYGTLEMQEYCEALFKAMPDLVASVDNVAAIPYLGEAVDIAVRWSMAGTHSGDGLFGPSSGAPLYILGISHWRVINGRIREEWTVFDELALRRQIETHRLATDR